MRNNLILQVEVTDYGHENVNYNLLLEEDEPYYTQLYIPSLDRIIHGSVVGHDPSGIQHVRYRVSLSHEDYQKLNTAMSEAGWENSYVD